VGHFHIDIRAKWRWRCSAPSNKRLQLALRLFVQRLLLCGKVSSLVMVRSCCGLCSVHPRAPQGAAEAQSR